jgi:hypothetical protein
VAVLSAFKQMPFVFGVCTMFAARFKLISVFCAATLSGCGTYVPDMQLSNTEDAEGFAENVIVNNVQCELMMGVKKRLITSVGPDCSMTSLGWRIGELQ